ncbi:MAG: hypothetical protein U0229_10085 [Anaeromyxobacter sp.]
MPPGLPLRSLASLLVACTSCATAVTSSPAASAAASAGAGSAASPAASARAPAFSLLGTPELVLPGVVSTAASTEIRLAVSPDGARLLWGAIGQPGAPRGWEILESRRTAAGWSTPAPAPFDSAANDFDPSFAPDGSGAYFFSNRPGGLGGDDLWFTPLGKDGAWGEPVNLGPGVNTKGDEWAPSVSPDGTQLLFCSDARGGPGRQDLFVARRGADGAWSDARALAVNGPDDDFDATFLPDGSLVFSSGRTDGAVALYWAPANAPGPSARVRLGPEVNGEGAEPFTNGPSIAATEPGWLYFSARRSGGEGRMDIWRVPYRVER